MNRRTAAFAKEKTKSYLKKKLKQNQSTPPQEKKYKTRKNLPPKIQQHPKKQFKKYKTKRIQGTDSSITLVFLRGYIVKKFA